MAESCATGICRPVPEGRLRPGEKFSYRMEARNGGAGFDFSGTYDRVRPYELIESVLDDGRNVRVSFARRGGKTMITETFEVEAENSPERQRQGWQAILDSFKRYAENLGR